MNPSGKKERIVISCVTFEVEKVVQPIIHYEATKAYLIHYVRDSGDNASNVYKDVYNEVCRRIMEAREVELIECKDRPVYNFQDMMKTVIEIIGNERRDSDCNVDIYINVSSGTSEYAAAAMMASMMMENTTPFSVSTKEFAMDEDTIREICYKDGKPVGLSLKVNEPKAVPKVSPDFPDAELVNALKAIKKAYEKYRFPKFMDFIDIMKADETWNYESDASRNKCDDGQKERMKFKRSYINPMIEKGWIIENEINRNQYKITSKGEAILYIFT